MRKGWLIPLILVVVIGVMGFGLTGEKAQKVQKISREPVAAERLGCELEACNPLREEQYPATDFIVSASSASVGTE